MSCCNKFLRIHALVNWFPTWNWPQYLANVCSAFCQSVKRKKIICLLFKSHSGVSIVFVETSPRCICFYYSWIYWALSTINARLPTAQKISYPIEVGTSSKRHIFLTLCPSSTLESLAFKWRVSLFIGVWSGQ